MEYHILCKGRKIFKFLSEEECDIIVGDLKVQYYQTGSPHPNEIEIEVIGDSEWQKQKLV